MDIRIASSARVGLIAAALLAATTVPGTATAAPADGPVTSAQTIVERYGPYTVPAMGQLENQVSRIRPACDGCFITAMVPDLVYADGSPANYNTGGMLHHAVFFSSAHPDATCDSPLGQRFFASGNERTPMRVPAGYGYRVGAADQWAVLYDLMNMSMAEQTFYIEVSYTVRDDTAGLTQVRPVWLDIDQCGDSEYSIPAGYSDTHADWTVDAPGRVVAAAGHIHDDGVRIEATRETSGSVSICDSVAGYGETPGYIDPSGGVHLSSMSTCVDDSLAVLRRGDVVRLHSVYDSPEPQHDVMGIMLLYLA